MELRTISKNVEKYYKFVKEISESRKIRNFDNALSASIQSIDYIESLLMWDIYDAERTKLLHKILVNTKVSSDEPTVEEDTWELLSKQIELNLEARKQQLNFSNLPCVNYLFDHYSVFGNEEIILKLEDLLNQFNISDKWKDELEKLQQEKTITGMIISLLRKEPTSYSEIRSQLGVDYNIRGIIDRLVQFNVIKKKMTNFF